MQAVYNNSRDAFLKKEAEYTGVLQEYERLEKRKSTLAKEIELSDITLSENIKKIGNLKDNINIASQKQAELEEKRSCL